MANEEYKFPDEVDEKPAPKAEAPKAETPPAEPKSVAMYVKAREMANRGENDTAAYWAAVAQHEREQGRVASNDYSDTAVGKFFSGLFGGKKVDEATKYLSMNPSSTNMFAEAKKVKKADKDYDGDGEIESSKDEVIGSRRKAAGLDETIAPVTKLSPVGDKKVDEKSIPAKKKHKKYEGTVIPSEIKKDDKKVEEKVAEKPTKKKHKKYEGTKIPDAKK